MNGASSGFTRNTTRTSSCMVKPSFDITSNVSNVFFISLTLSYHFLANHTYLEEMRVNVISSGPTNVLLRTTLSARRDERVSVLKIIVSLFSSRDVILRIERSTIECFDKSDLIFADHSRV